MSSIEFESSVQTMFSSNYNLIFYQKTKGGVLLPEKGIGKVLEATVVSAGPGVRDNVSAFNNVQSLPSVQKHKIIFVGVIIV